MFKRKLTDDETLDKILRECTLFEGFSGSELKALLKISHIRDYSADEKIFQEGTVGLCFYIIVKGSVDIISTQAGNTLVLKTYKQGAYFSEVHLFTETNHNVSCVSKEVSRMIIFAKPDFEDLIRLKPKIGNKLLLRFLEYLSIQLDLLYKENKELLRKLPNSSVY